MPTQHEKLTFLPVQHENLDKIELRVPAKPTGKEAAGGRLTHSLTHSRILSPDVNEDDGTTKI